MFAINWLEPAFQAAALRAAQPFAPAKESQIGPHLRKAPQVLDGGALGGGIDDQGEAVLMRDLDAVLFIRFYHDLFWQPRPDGKLIDRAEFLRRVYESLKPGGVFGVVDHHAQAFTLLLEVQ